MSTPKHTPGPWHYEQGKLGTTIWAAGRILIAKLSFPGAGKPCPSLADARLIAAAPELLEALKALLADSGGTIGTSEGHGFAIAARAAVAKAEGK